MALPVACTVGIVFLVPSWLLLFCSFLLGWCFLYRAGCCCFALSYLDGVSCTELAVVVLLFLTWMVFLVPSWLLLFGSLLLGWCLLYRVGCFYFASVVLLLIMSGWCYMAAVAFINIALILHSAETKSRFAGYWHLLLSPRTLLTWLTETVLRWTLLRLVFAAVAPYITYIDC